MTDTYIRYEDHEYIYFIRSNVYRVEGGVPVQPLYSADLVIGRADGSVVKNRYGPIPKAPTIPTEPAEQPRKKFFRRNK